MNSFINEFKVSWLKNYTPFFAIRDQYSDLCAVGSFSRLDISNYIRYFLDNTLLDDVDKYEEKKSKYLKLNEYIFKYFKNAYKYRKLTKLISYKYGSYSYDPYHLIFTDDKEKLETKIAYQ